MSGLPSTATICAWLGAATHPNGNATPKSNSRMGISIADSTPPALKSSHSHGSGCCLITYATQRISQAMSTDVRTHAT